MAIKMTVNIQKYELEDCYFCKTCNYKCDTKFLIKQHLSTRKHRNLHKEAPDIPCNQVSQSTVKAKKHKKNVIPHIKPNHIHVCIATNHIRNAPDYGDIIKHAWPLSQRVNPNKSTMIPLLRRRVLKILVN